MKRRRVEPGRFEIGGTEFLKVGTRRFDLRDPYHLAVTVGWAWFVALAVAADLVLNLLFAILYLMAPGAISNARPGSLLDAFFFSLETLSTVGYGEMAPATTYGHVVASVEVLVGLAFTAVVTGLIFVRFSKTNPRIRFAKRLVVARHHGHPTLMLRLGYARAGVLTGASAQLSVLLLKRDPDGRAYREFHVLPLTRAHMPMVVLTWTVMHTIDEHSPIAGMNSSALREAGARIVFAIEAGDPALGSRVQDMRIYAADEVTFGAVYKDIVSYEPDGGVRADLRRLDDIEPEPPAAR